MRPEQPHLPPLRVRTRLNDCRFDSGRRRVDRPAPVDPDDDFTWPGWEELLGGALLLALVILAYLELLLQAL